MCLYNTNKDAGLKEKWRKSMKKNPEMLTTEMGVIMIHTAVGNADRAKRKACRKAMKHLLEARKTSIVITHLNSKNEFNLSVVETQSETQKGASGQSFK